MRVLGFEKHWPKLDKPEFTTFRFPRRDRDWFLGERVQVVIKPRSKDRQPLFCAYITGKRMIKIRHITDMMASVDGFSDREDMMKWLHKKYRNSLKWTLQQSINRLTLREVYPYAGIEPRSRAIINKGGESPALETPTERRIENDVLSI